VFRLPAALPKSNNPILKSYCYSRRRPQTCGCCFSLDVQFHSKVSLMATTRSNFRGIAIAALLIAIGNIASRVVGLLREGVIASSFGRSATVDAFTAASSLTTILYDLLISGAISAALVPIFSEYAEEDLPTLWRVASTILTLAVLVVTAVCVLVAWQAPLAVAILAGGFAPDIREQAILMVRLLLPSVVMIGIAGLITALLQARQRFLLPAFTTSAYNLGIIAGVLLLTPWLGATSLVAGVLLGAFCQVLLQLPGLRDAQLRPALELRHPAVRRILRLYAPVAIGIGFSVIGIVLDRNLASQVGQNALSTMRYATTLIQLPLGLVAAAISFAILPTLSRQAGSDEHGYRTTLAMGLKVVLLLILPATAGLFALAEPIVQLLFERGSFRHEDTLATAQALRFYLPGLPAAGLDQVLLFAFYARKRTLAPNLVQGAAIGFYMLTALGLLNTTSLRVEALVLGNSVQWIAHLVILAILARGMINIHGLRIGEAALKCGVAALGVAGAAWLTAQALAAYGALAQVAGAAVIGGICYAALCVALRVEAVRYMIGVVQQRRGGG
jgi:putative peptidoglycan lipid II flippase